MAPEPIITDTTPVNCFAQAEVLLNEIVVHKDDPEFTEPAATLLVHSAIACSLQGLLAAKILDQQP